MIKVEHELHGRRKSRNIGVGILLIGLATIVFGLTVVKVIQLGDLRKFESFDHVARPQIIPEADVPAEPATQIPVVSE